MRRTPGEVLLAEARRLARLLARHRVGTIARRRGVSPATISKTAALARLPVEIAEAVAADRTGRLAKKEALYRIARAAPDVQRAMWERLRRGDGAPRRRSGSVVLPPTVETMLQGLTRAAGRTVAVEERDGEPVGRLIGDSRFANGDVIFITDGCAEVPEASASLLEKARTHRGLSLYTLLVGTPGHPSLTAISDGVAHVAGDADAQVFDLMYGS